MKDDFKNIFNKKSKYTLNNLLKEFRTSGFLDAYIIDRIDKLRLKRNPFVHHKEPMQKDTLLVRSFESKMNIDELIQKDAKEALSLMLTMSQMKII